MNRLMAFGIAMVACFTFGEAAQAAKRVALVIGNSAYEAVAPLNNTENDARAIAGKLRDLGFEVVEGLSLDRLGMEDALDEFGRKAQGAEMAVAFYAGHGIQVAGQNYLIPVDAKLDEERDLRRLITLDDVMADASLAKEVGIVILDSCRDNPFSASLKNSMGATRSAAVGRGLAKVDDTPAQTLVAFATRADAVASDGATDHSPYTEALLHHLDEPGLDVGLFFRKVRGSVLERTNDKQEPFTYGSLGADLVYFNEPDDTQVAVLPDPTGDTTGDEVDNSRRGEDIFWETVRDSDNPADLEAYLELYPDGVYVPLAENRLRSLADQDKLQQTADQQSDDQPVKSDESYNTATAPAQVPVQVPVQVEAMNETWYVKQTANVRGGPGKEHEKLGTLRAGNAVTVTGKVSGKKWYRLALSDGRTGYMAGFLLSDKKTYQAATQGTSSTRSEEKKNTATELNADVAAQLEAQYQAEQRQKQEAERLRQQQLQQQQQQQMYQQKQQELQLLNNLLGGIRRY